MKRQRLPTIGELNQRALEGEKLRLENDDEATRVELERLIDDWRHGLPLRRADRDLLMTAVSEWLTVPKLRRGANAKSWRESAAKKEAVAYVRSLHKQIKPQCDTADEAWERTAAQARRDRPNVFAGKATRAIQDMVSRRPNSGT